MNCNHYETVSHFEEWENEFTGVTVSEWKSEEVSLQVDIDLHRFQCTRCLQIGYYSSAARAYYTEGTRSPGIEGLE